MAVTATGQHIIDYAREDTATAGGTFGEPQSTGIYSLTLAQRALSGDRIRTGSYARSSFFNANPEKGLVVTSRFK